MVEVGRDPPELTEPNPSAKHHLQQSAGERVQAGLESLQRVFKSLLQEMQDARRQD